MIARAGVLCDCRICSALRSRDFECLAAIADKEFFTVIFDERYFVPGRIPVTPSFVVTAIR